MSALRSLVLVHLAACLGACAAAPCAGLDGGAPIDAPPEIDAAPIGRDAQIADAGLAECPAIRPAQLNVASIFLAGAPADTRHCAGSGGGAFRVRIFRHGETVPVADTAPGFITCDTAFEALAPGEYDLAIDRTDDTRWVVGAAIIRPESCVSDPDAPHCAPIRIRHTPCRARYVTAVLHCDPTGDPSRCPARDWPWAEGAR